MEHLRNTLKLLEEANFKINVDKCTFGKKEIQFMGHIISKEGIKANPEKLGCIRKMQAPNNRSEHASLLGFCNYYQKFIEKFAELAYPLYELLKVNKTFEWNNEAETAFKNVKNALMLLSVLKFPLENQPLPVYTDASGHSLGIKLSQFIHNIDCPIAFASRKLKPAEMNYSTTDREMLGIVWACRNFRKYLLGRHFTVHYHHNPLQYLSNFRDSHYRRARWLSILSEFDFSVKYIPGSKNVIVDSLSNLVSGVTLESDLTIRGQQKLDI
ncbi:Retrovirus-related Pol polyprotein from transposon 17.6 [Thelohanellus kitauei]|uniref:Retrovirus-related Pol polyprotein from transposon 17.6 n=1 Tax=Thelohanellus kitauei TaxID=669202 RepID=A0A0C2ICF9_THEKT|nr:Retrovirus-related Pol polyprotein from transposon 17.6 [Thelohanellus kitauei]